MKFSFKSLCRPFTEIISIVISFSTEVLQNNTTSSSYISPVIDRSSFSTENLIKESSLISLKFRQITSSLRSSVHLQSNFNFISGFKHVHIISKLFCICVFCEQRSNRHFLLTSLIYLIRRSSLMLSFRNIFFTDMMSIYINNSSSNI